MGGHPVPQSGKSGPNLAHQVKPVEATPTFTDGHHRLF